MVKGEGLLRRGWGWGCPCSPAPNKMFLVFPCSPRVFPRFKCSLFPKICFCSRVTSSLYDYIPFIPMLMAMFQCSLNPLGEFLSSKCTYTCNFYEHRNSYPYRLPRTPPLYYRKNVKNPNKLLETFSNKI